uniref:Short neurotoxin SNTX-1 n=1 Tax=Demansia vestigiata TaxID=412038 RepID=3S11_DEMVE|nr:RecName: Full=Short neurotoxin SNTX-1; Flags: Precursor [Demansia vestigiata]ABK63546.1 SNTX-1 precursor [Demansia vestigiata]
MKTLLLILVVVTIVCLDLVCCSRTCCNQQSSQPKTTTVCPDGEKSCYKKSWRDHRGTRSERGCGCPTVKPGVNRECCDTDECNN